MTRSPVAVVAGALALVLAACGSQLDPGTVAQVNGTTAGSGAQGGVVGGDTGTAADGSLPGGTTGGSTGSTGSTGVTTGGTGGTPAQGEGDEAPTGSGKAGNCDGFDNDQTGISSDKIVIANTADISGPIPGIFASAQEATRAYVAYFNATSDICGHKLEVQALDSRTDAGADQQAYAKACDDAFAAVGSMSAFDSGGAATAQDCGIPDMRSTMVTPARRNCSTCFSAQAVSPALVPDAMPKYWLDKNRDATQHVGIFYVDVGAAAVNSESFKVAWEKNGWNVDLYQSIDSGEFNYAPYVQQMKDADIDFVVYVGPYQNTIKLQQAMKQQNFEPAVFLQDSTINDQNYVDQAGSLGEGTYVYGNTAPFDNYKIPEMALYRAWLDQVKPGAIPSMYGLYAWSATRLFVEQATALGGKLTRESLIEALGKVKDWTGNGVHAPQQVAAKTTSNCINVLQLRDGKWVQVSPGNFVCGGLTDSGVSD